MMPMKLSVQKKKSGGKSKESHAISKEMDEIRDQRMLKRYRLRTCLVEIRNENLELTCRNDKKERLRVKEALLRTNRIFGVKKKAEKGAQLPVKKIVKACNNEKLPRLIHGKETSTENLEILITPSTSEKRNNGSAFKELSNMSSKKICQKRGNKDSDGVSDEFNRSKRPCFDLSAAVTKSVVANPTVSAQQSSMTPINAGILRNIEEMPRRASALMDAAIHSNTEEPPRRDSSPPRASFQTPEKRLNMCCVCQKVIDCNVQCEMGEHSAYCSISCILNEVEVITQMFNPFGRVKMVDGSGLLLDDFELPMIEQLESFLCQNPNYIAVVMSDKRKKGKLQTKLAQDAPKEITSTKSSTQVNLQIDKQFLEATEKSSAHDVPKPRDTTSEHKSHVYDLNCRICENEDKQRENRKQGKDQSNPDGKKKKKQVVRLTDPRRPTNAAEGNKNKDHSEQDRRKDGRNESRSAFTSPTVVSSPPITSIRQHPAGSSVQPLNFLEKKRHERESSEEDRCQNESLHCMRKDPKKQIMTLLNDDNNKKNSPAEDWNTKKSAPPAVSPNQLNGSAVQTLKELENSPQILTNRKVASVGGTPSSQRRINVGSVSSGIFSWGRQFNFSCSFVGLSNQLHVGLRHEKLVNKLMIKVAAMVEPHVVWGILSSLNSAGCAKQIIVMLLEPPNYGDLGKNSSLAMESQNMHAECARLLDQNGKFGVLDLTMHGTFAEGFIFSLFGGQKFPWQLKEVARPVEVAKNTYKIFLVFIQKRDCNNDALLVSTAEYEANISHVLSESSNGSAVWNTGMNENFRSVVDSPLVYPRIEDQFSGIFQ